MSTSTLPYLAENAAYSFGVTGEAAETRNMLIEGDNLPVMQSLIDMGYAGTIDCVQIDPPYNTGDNFGDYNDAQAVDVWCADLRARISLMHTLLKDTGFLVCHIDRTHSHDLRNILDDVFGRQNYRETFQVNTKHPDPSMPDKDAYIHRSMEEIQVYAKSPKAQPFLPDGTPMTDYIDGATLGDRSVEGGVTFRGGKKPEALIRYAFDHFSPTGGLVLDAYLGSGTGAAVAAKMGRTWIGISRHHAQSHCLPRLKGVVEGSDQTGISQAVGWQGGGGYKFYTLKDQVDSRVAP